VGDEAAVAAEDFQRQEVLSGLLVVRTDAHEVAGAVGLRIGLGVVVGPPEQDAVRAVQDVDCSFGRIGTSSTYAINSSVRGSLLDFLL